MSNNMTLLEEINKDCVVQPGDLRIPEYTFMKIYDFSKKRPKVPGKQDKEYSQKFTQYELDQDAYQGQIDKLCIVITALLNTSGGVVILHSPDKAETKTIDSWLNNLHQQLKVIPKWIFDESVRTSVRADTVTFLVKAAPVFRLITFKSNLYVRNPGATSEMCNDAEQLKTIINKQPTRHVYAGYDSKKKGDEVGTESLNLEHKYWDIRTSDDILERLKNNPQALLGLANVEGGGDFVIGVEEDKSSKKNIVRGVDLSESERKILPDKLDFWLSTMITGTHKKLRRGVDWSVKFINVSEEAGEQERCLVIIHLNHCQGGLFLRKPQCYVVSDKGDIEEMPFEQWLDDFSVSAILSSEPGSSSSDLKSSLTSSNKSDTSCLSTSTRSLISVSSPSSLHKPITGAYSPDTTSKAPKYLSDSQRISSVSLSQDDEWRRRLEDRDYPDNYEDIKGRLDIRETSPILFSPSTDKVIQMCLENCSPGSFTETDITTALQLIQDRHKDRKGFALSFCSWDQAFDNEDPLTAPTWHAFDVLVKTEDSMELIAVFGDYDKFQRAGHKQYLHSLCRKIKRHLLSNLKQVQPENIANITICPVICNIKQQRMESCLAPSDLIVKDFQDIWRSEQMMTHEALTHSLKNVLFTKSIHIRDRVNRDRNLKLTEKQVECTVRCIDSRFTLIDAAPGAGKSVMISYLTDRWNGGNKLKVLCICPRKPFTQFLLNQQKCDVVQACDDETMCKVIKQITEGKYAAIVVDDGQAMTCKRLTWIQFYTAVLESKCRKIGTKLCIVLDSRFQIFDGQQNANRIKTSFREFCNKNNTTPTELSLCKVLRNEQKVFSFMLCNILQEHSIDAKDFLCYQPGEGDDVQLKAVDRLWEYSLKNGLITIVRILVSGGETYMPTDIVILVDKEKDAKYLLQLFGKYLPEVTVHDASRIPAEGVTVETTGNVIGLEYLVVLHASRQDAEHTRSFTDRRYRTFIASRGIRRVEFLFPRSFTVKIAKTMVHEDISRPATLLDSCHDQPPVVFCEKGEESGQFDRIEGVCVLVSGNVVLCDNGRGCLSVYSPQGDFITSHSMASVHDVASTSDGGMVCVTDQVLYRLDKDGKEVWSVGRLYLAPPHRQPFRYSRGEDTHLVGVCVDRQGMVYTRLSHSVCVVRADGEVMKYIEKNVPVADQIYYQGIAVHISGDILLTDHGNHQIIVLSEITQSKTTFRGLGPCGVAVDSCGNVAVTSRDTHSVTVYSPTWQYIKSWGKLSGATGIAISPSGDIFVCCHGSYNVQIF